MGDPANGIEVSGRVVRLEVENFKSYRGFQNIGPFKNFTAVVGPNGSGKSNLMDAISFVLGVKTAQLRGSLKELLYSNSAGQSAEDRPRKGFVKLVYENADQEETHFSRIITPSSSSAADATFSSQYKLHSKTVSWEGYNNQLKQYKILVKARNFLVFQVSHSVLSLFGSCPLQQMGTGTWRSTCTQSCMPGCGYVYRVT